MKTGNKSEVNPYRKQAFKSSEILLRKTKKAAQLRAEAYKLRGICYWLVNKQKRAYKWWLKALQEGRRLGANLELPRIYFEIGKRLLEPGSMHEGLNGIKAEEYLEKAKALFEKMELQWDLDEVSRAISGMKSSFFRKE